MTITPSAGTAAEIRALMAKKGRKQVELAQFLGLSQSATSARLTGQHQLTVNELVQIADWLGADAAGILTAALVDMGGAA